MTFRIRKKPKKPVRETIEDRFWVDFTGRVPLDGLNGALRDQVKRQLDMDHAYYKQAGITLDNYDSFELEPENNGWSDAPDEWYVIGTRKETDQEFKKRQSCYEKRIAEYNKWESENRDKIAAELKRRAQDKKNRIKKKRAAVVKQRDAEIAKLERQLKKLKGA